MLVVDAFGIFRDDDMLFRDDFRDDLEMFRELDGEV